jgi:hypothetical protein
MEPCPLQIQDPHPSKSLKSSPSSRGQINSSLPHRGAAPPSILCLPMNLCSIAPPYHLADLSASAPARMPVVLQANDKHS